MNWIGANTPQDALFTARMFSAPHIRLIGKRRTTIHPQVRLNANANANTTMNSGLFLDTYVDFFFYFFLFSASILFCLCQTLGLLTIKNTCCGITLLPLPRPMLSVLSLLLFAIVAVGRCRHSQTRTVGVRNLLALLGGRCLEVAAPH